MDRFGPQMDPSGFNWTPIFFLADELCCEHRSNQVRTMALIETRLRVLRADQLH